MAANFKLIFAWNTSAIFESFRFSRFNRMRGLFVKHLVFSFNLKSGKHEVMIAADVAAWERS